MARTARGCVSCVPPPQIPGVMRTMCAMNEYGGGVADAKDVVTGASVGRHKYPMVRVGGLFILCVGLGLIAGTIAGGEGLVDRRVFFVGVGAATMSLFLSGKLSYGPPLRFQLVALLGAIVLEIVLMSALGPLLGPTDVRTFWLWTLVIVGVHFVPMAVAFGPVMLLLGAACVASAASGLLVPSLPFAFLAICDG